MANEWDCDATHWAAMSCDAAAAPAVCQGAGWRLRGGAARNPTRKVRGGAHVGVLLETLLVRCGVALTWGCCSKPYS
jgi:hypothetical protein